MFKVLFLLTASLIISCLYTNVKSPGWYYSQNYTDVKGMEIVGKLSGETCADAWFWAVYTGDESFDTAVSNAIKDKADLLFNVQTDYSTESYVFNLKMKKCTRVTGIGVKIPGGVKSSK
jgi:hypothetical protein